MRHLDSADVALCIECYTVGVKVHGTTTWGWEKCHVVEAAASGRPLLVEDWLADQEVGLLDGILRYGFGNWHAVAEHMGDNKTEVSCEEHYTSFYLRQKPFPLPDLSGPRPVTPAPSWQIVVVVGRRPRLGVVRAFRAEFAVVDAGFGDPVLESPGWADRAVGLLVVQVAVRRIIVVVASGHFVDRY